MLTFEEKMEPDTILRDPNLLVGVCFLFCGILIYLLIYLLFVTLCQLFPTFQYMGMLCMDHLEKVTGSTAFKL